MEKNQPKSLLDGEIAAQSMVTDPELTAVTDIEARRQRVLDALKALRGDIE